jgi:hypothetical protein
MNLPELYRLAAQEGSFGDRARQVREQLDWFAGLVEFDPKSGDCLPVGVGTLLSRAANRQQQGVTRDRLWRIIEHSRTSIHRILKQLAEEPRREQTMLHIRSVRSLDPGSFAALSRRPGRNIREKLADKPVMLAPRTYQSLDLPQNRLLKEFLVRIADLIEIRKNTLGEDDELLADIRRWLRSDEAMSISRWTHMPPNNVLLSHRDYRRVWDAWRWLEALDDQCTFDYEQSDLRVTTMTEWDEWTRGYATELWRFGELPVILDYEAFTIKKWRDLIVTEDQLQPRATSETRITGPVCIDLSHACPRYAIAGSDEYSIFSEKFIWQRWFRDEYQVEIELFGADVVVVAPDENVTVSAPDLLVSATLDNSVLERAASRFAERLSRIVDGHQMVWLVPDSVNDFELQVARRNINARIPRSTPLPRSVAAVIETIDYGTITGEDYVVLVTDDVGGTLCATKLISRYDPELESRVPETHGYYWERTPTVVFLQDEHLVRPLDGVPYAYQQENELLLDDGQDEKVRRAVDESMLLTHPDIGECDVIVEIIESPVVGGVQVLGLQQKAGEIPIWRDQIPELSMKVLERGLRTNFTLVSPHTTIRPVQGVAVPIEVSKSFTLTAGQAKFAFPLVQGSASSALGFQAELRSPSFPLSHDAVCDLMLTYTYGADDPYDLTFISKDKSFVPVKARWGRQLNKMETSEMSHLPVPQFPAKPDWVSLQRWPRLVADKRTGSMYSDLIEWVSGAIASLVNLQGAVVPDSRVDEQLSELLASRVTGVVTGTNSDVNGQFFCFVYAEGEDVFCHGKEFLEQAEIPNVREGDQLHFQIRYSNGRTQGRLISRAQKNPPSLRKKVVQGGGKNGNLTPEAVQDRVFKARFPSYTIWDSGRSIQDANCPKVFRESIEAAMPSIVQAYGNSKLPENLREEAFLFLCRIHKDAPAQIVEQLRTTADKNRLNRIEVDAIAYAIGDCSNEWQLYLLENILQCRYQDWVRMLAVALWRSEEVISFVSFTHMVELLPHLFNACDETVGRARNGGFKGIESGLEVLLALLRTREIGDESLTAVLSPGSEYGTAFTDLIDELTEIVVVQGHQLKTRVALQVEKPEEFRRIPDLLYALRLYLTGDDGADAVRISDVTWD